MRGMRLPVLSGGIVALSLAFGLATAADSTDRTVTVEDMRNDRPAFYVRVEVDHPNRIYRGGDVLGIDVVSEKKGFLYLINELADGTWTCLFPNQYQRNNHIAANQKIRVPSPKADFCLRVGPPFGNELIKAIVTTKPIDVRHFRVNSLTKSSATPLDAESIKAVYVELRRRPVTEWAEHDVRITTVPPDTVVKQRRPRRVLLIIGISKYQDRRIRDLTVGDRDARRIADVMKRYGQMDQIILLVDAQATLENIRRAVCQTLAENTIPGDEVIIYFSGHGGRCADDADEEQDGLDEYLVPYDGRLDDLAAIRQTMLLDDTFGRWLLCLDGRRIALILDTCCSGGQSKYEKGLGSGDPASADGPFDFLDGELARTKDVGQPETAMLYSAKPDQIAFERRELDLSVMTYSLVSLLERATGPVTLTQAFDHVKVEVPRYVEEEFSGSCQTPGLINNLSTVLYLRP